MPRIDLTPFGFTPTESLVYEVLLTGGPGTGYAVARAAGLARANAYSALEALVQKGAARADAGRPRRYRPEPPAALVARIANRHGEALDVLGAQLHGVAVPASPSLVEIDSPRAALQLITHDVARAQESVEIFAPGDAYPLLAPALRRALPRAFRPYRPGVGVGRRVQLRLPARSADRAAEILAHPLPMIANRADDAAFRPGHAQGRRRDPARCRCRPSRPSSPKG